MIHAVQLNLPDPPTDIQQRLIAELELINLDPDRKRWLDEFHGGQVNSVQHTFELAPEFWQTVVKDLYQKYFDRHEIQAGFGIMKNDGPSNACLPPHTDRGRALAINYYLSTGGSSVQTQFYDLHEEIKHAQSSNFSYRRVGPCVFSHTFDRAWYAYNVNQAHSVENIETCRYVLLLLIKDKPATYDLNCLRSDYPELIRSVF